MPAICLRVGEGVDATPVSPHSVLVVEADAVDRDLLSGHLEGQGHTVAVAPSGCQALEMVGAEEFDLVLLNVVLPDMTGLEVLRRGRAAEALRDLPILMTATSS